MFASRKRGREDREDDLQHYAPDTKASAATIPHQGRVADLPNRDQLYPSVPRPIPDIFALSLNHEADLPLSSHKQSRLQILQRKKTRRPFNLQTELTDKIIQSLAPAPPFKETRALIQTWI